MGQAEYVSRRSKMSDSIKDAIKRANRARCFPYGTDGASRHVQIMAETLARYGRYPMFDDEPEHCAESLLATVASLWEARIMLAKAGIQWSTLTTLEEIKILARKRLST